MTATINRNKTNTAMKKQNIYIDLSKCTEEQRKHIEFLTGEKFYVYKFCHLGQSAFTDDIKFFGFNDIPKGYSKTELTYPEFIKLFEGAETIKSDNTETLANALHQIEKLEADKAELLEALEKVHKEVTSMPILYIKIKSLIQKHKQ